MYEYELKYNFFDNGNDFGGNTPVIALVFIFALVVTLTNKKENYKPKAIFFSLGIIFSLCFISFNFFSFYNTFNIIENKFKNGDYKTIIGEVKEYKGDNPHIKADGESFYIDTVFFSYTRGKANKGYTLPCSYGGFICENGQKVKIEYIDNLNTVPFSQTNKISNRIIKLSLVKNSK